MNERTYRNEASAEDYLRWRNSVDGQYECGVIRDALAPFLPSNTDVRILDAGCGDGWLTRAFRKKYLGAQGCDISEHLVSLAQTNDPQGNYGVSDMTETLPYEKEFFDVILSVMSLHDMKDLDATYRNLFSVLRPGGTLIAVVANPYYSYPVGMWKRGLLGKVFFRKPSLRLRPYGFFVRSLERLFTWNNSVPSYFRTIPEYLNGAKGAGFALERYQDILADADTPAYGRQYQLYRFPMMVMVVLKKPMA